jgi:hypothetical protein
MGKRSYPGPIICKAKGYLTSKFCKSMGTHLVHWWEEKKNTRNISGCWWLTPVFLATQEAEIRMIEV